ncbi:hypothetical protein JKP88DRAFT_233372 [Tribonema minus]|uniref:Uncharacterized protein n=1 Tax=Tribonema minus TaxID=303371 RepID=A0A836CN16_9STRA|nr:hypothetical protein JKP88DRAFT_233372 [Tribonema minus]
MNDLRHTISVILTLSRPTTARALAAKMHTTLTLTARRRGARAVWSRGGRPGGTGAGGGCATCAHCVLIIGARPDASWRYARAHVASASVGQRTHTSGTHKGDAPLSKRGGCGAWPRAKLK